MKPQLTLYTSLQAYLSIALDGTGALESLALWVSKKAGPSGRKLFFVLYAFFFVLACIVGNDPLILSGTPFLSYLVKHGDLPSPLPLVFAEFITGEEHSSYSTFGPAVAVCLRVLVQLTPVQLSWSLQTQRERL